MNSGIGLDITQKNGDPHNLKGKLIAYATLDSESVSNSGSLESMVRNGILAVQANYVDQRNIRDFFRAEFGVSLEKGISEIIEQAKESGGLEGALDPEGVRDKLESMRNMEFIPIPAKIALFSSEEEILEREEDIFYLGHFSIASHAHLCVNSFPILYQAKFREQENRALMQEIDQMLKGLTSSSAEGGESESEGINHFKGDVKAHLLKKLIPDMLYNQNNPDAYRKAELRFRRFMSDYSNPEDMEEIVRMTASNLKSENRLSKLELLVNKIQALQSENYAELENIKKKMRKLE